MIDKCENLWQFLFYQEYNILVINIYSENLNYLHEVDYTSPAYTIWIIL